ncbi:MAG: TIGR00730 family Rossman fold protein [Clostridiales bacterium]|nr:TIGR00730 family Rossman fold protein [Clostridiales bacterium]
MDKLSICVYGAASSKIDSVFITESEKLGEEIALRNHNLVYGGGASGVMGACARGATRFGGTIIGVVPEFIDNFEKINENCTQLIRTKTMGERKEVMEEMADAFIIAPGGIGTFDEFFQILTLTELERKKAPIVLYNVSGYYDNLIQFIHSCIEKKFIKERSGEIFHITSSPKQAIDLVEVFYSQT